MPSCIFLKEEKNHALSEGKILDFYTGIMVELFVFKSHFSMLELLFYQ